MKYNNEFEKINTQEKAYFLGFAFADGCISKKRGKKSVFRMSLADKCIIEKFARLFPFFKTDEFDYSKYKSNHSKQFAIRKVDTQLYLDLYNNGMLERKSGENAELLNLPFLSENLYSHFIRGFFDGDGSINIPSKRPNLRRVEICSSSENFIKQLKSKLEEKGINCPIFRKRIDNRIKPLFILEWINTDDILKFKDFLYKNSIIHLERKKEKFDSLRRIDKTDNNPLSPCCNFKSCKQGSRLMKHGLMLRYCCKSCNKKFSIPAQVKQGELLETPDVKQDNQQPSLDSNILEGSTTNNRVLPNNVEDSNVNTSALPS